VADFRTIRTRVSEAEANLASMRERLAKVSADLADLPTRKNWAGDKVVAQLSKAQVEADTLTSKIAEAERGLALLKPHAETARGAVVAELERTSHDVALEIRSRLEARRQEAYQALALQAGPILTTACTLTAAMFRLLQESKTRRPDALASLLDEVSGDANQPTTPAVALAPDHP
jgi:hypothetical protein